MGLDIGNALSKIKDNVVDAFHKAEETPVRVFSEVEENIETAGNFFKETAENIGDVFASRNGLAIFLNPLSLRLPDIFPKSNPDKQFDGALVGANAQTFPPNTPLSDIPAVAPNGGIRNNETLIYVNGIQTDVAGQTRSLQAIADNSGSRVIGVHNATGTFAGDLLQSLGDKLDIGRNPAVDTLADTVYNELKAGRDVHLTAHSQGAIITSRALTDVQNRLMLEDGMSRQQSENLMNNIKVETFGGAARRYPDGPQYVHYVNRNDGVPQSTGLRSWLNPFAHAGKDAVTHYFREGKPVVSHGFEEFYLPERVPFEQARQGIFN
ncbi:MAG: hypothetical protein ABIP06_09135 [Pyrinomonadaceae bacterium]